MFRYYTLSSWMIGTFWFLCRCVFPKNPNIAQNIPLIVTNQIIQSVGLIYSSSMFATDLYPDSLQTVITHLSCFVWIEEFLFYYLHRILHNRFIYNHIHHIHHRYRISYADVALYTHPLEHIVCNGFPVLVGPVILQSDFTTLSLWLTLVTVNACWTHSGTNLEEIHDIHHKNSTANYGVLGLMDQRHGTLLSRVFCD